MPFQSLEQGVAAIQQGHFVEGARLIRIALKSSQIQGELRATGLLWLAETTDDPQQKLDYYTEAIEADPGNTEAQHRIAQLMAAGLPSSAGGTGARCVNVLPRGAEHTLHPPAGSSSSHGKVNHIVGIFDGPNGPGSGFFVTQDGLLATTRYVVGGNENVSLQLSPGRAAAGRVVRSFPIVDLALIHTGLAPDSLPIVARERDLPPNAPLFAYYHDGHQLAGVHRETKSRIPPGWFPTTFDQQYDAGGNPIFDGRNHLVGMLTRNANRTSDYVFALRIAVVFQCVDRYLQEIGARKPAVYCPVCGNLSQAGAAGGFYCETCGATLPQSLEVVRRPLPQMAAFYGVHRQRPCPNCRSRVGYYGDRCLRCGSDISR